MHTQEWTWPMRVVVAIYALVGLVLAYGAVLLFLQHPAIIVLYIGIAFAVRY